ncbi:signal sequence receptor beta-like protein [Aphelenchoides avenae]|nr:signal sequence receptor beta-like protein [Aphelenchus avenae]
MRTALLCLALVLATVFAQDEVVKEPAALNAARVLASKFSLSQYAVENLDYVIEYNLYNVGDKTALKVTLDDRQSFPTQSFEIVKGMLQVRWERIAPGGNVTHSVIVRPRSYGAFNYTAALVTYYPSEDAKEVRVGYTTAPGEGYIYRQKDYDRRFASKLGVWLVFLLFAAPTTVLPFVMWLKVKSKYDESSKREQQRKAK